MSRQSQRTGPLSSLLLSGCRFRRRAKAVPGTQCCAQQHWPNVAVLMAFAMKFPRNPNVAPRFLHAMDHQKTRPWSGSRRPLMIFPRNPGSKLQPKAPLQNFLVDGFWRRQGMKCKMRAVQMKYWPFLFALSSPGFTALLKTISATGSLLQIFIIFHTAAERDRA